MRLNNDLATFIKSGLLKIAAESNIYLFGSRTDDSAKGGDIDILCLSQTKIPRRLIREFKIEFYKNFGWRKIDIVNFTYDDNNIFKDITLKQAIEL